MATTLRFILLGDDRASSAFDRFAKQVEQSSKAVDRNRVALQRQQEQQDKTGKSLTGLIGNVTGFADVAGAASSEASVFQRALAAVNVATGVAEPVLAGLVVTAGGAAAAFAAAGGGAIAYKAALTPLLAEVKNVGDAQTKADAARQKAQIAYTAALASGSSKQSAAAARTRALTTAQKQYAAAVAGTPAPVRAFAKSLDDTQKSYQKWANQLASPVLAPLQRGLDLVKPALHDISPLVLAASKALGILEGQLGKSIQGGGLERVVSTVLPHVEPAILTLGHSVGNVAAGIGGIVMAFLPMADEVGSGTEKLTGKFRQWAQSLPSHSGFQSLMTTFKTETPLANQVLKNLVLILHNVGSATVGLASPANSKALLQILIPVTQVMARLSANQGLVRTVIYLGLLKSSLGKLTGAFGSVKTGVGAIQNLTTAVQKAYGVTGRFTGGYQNAAVAASAFSGKAGTLGGKLAALVERTGKFGVVATALAGPLGVAALAVGALAIATDGFKPTVTGSADALTKQYQAIGFNVTGYQNLAKATDLATGTATRSAQVMAGEASALSKVTGNSTDAGLAVQVLDRVHAQAATAAGNLSGGLAILGQAYRLTQSQATQLAAKAGVSANSLAASGNAGQTAFRKIVAYAGGAGQAAVQSIRLTGAETNLNNALARVTNNLLAGQQSLITWRQAQQTALQAINASTTGLKGQSAAALNAKQAVVQSTSAAIDLANAQSHQRNGMAAATRTIQDQINWLQKHGDKSKFATQEIRALEAAQAQLKSQHITETVTGSGTFTVNAPGTGGKRLTGLSTGGGVRGPGGPADDRAGLYALSNREWVIRANAATAYGDKAMDAVNRGHATILYPGMAGGGIVPSYKGNVRGLGPWTSSNVAAVATMLEKSVAKTGSAAIRASQAASSGGFGGISGGGGGGPNVAIGQRMAASIGWTGNNWAYLRAGWMEESGWRTNAQNTSGGGTPYTAAYGIPQSNPGSKMAAAGADWLTSAPTQIKWGLGYIRSTYGSPTGVPLWSANGPLPGYQGYAAGGMVGGGKGPVKPKKPVNVPGGGSSKYLRDAAELKRDQDELDKLTRQSAAHIHTMRIPLERHQLYLLNHPGLPASRHKTLQAQIDAEEKAISKYRGKMSDREGVLSKKITLLRQLLKSDPKPAPGRGVAPPPVNLGSKKDMLAQLARDVTTLTTVEKNAAKHTAALQLPIDREELYLLTNPNLSPAKRAALKEQIARQEKGLKVYRKAVTGRENSLQKQIGLLRTLTGEPTDAKYGGTGPAGDGTGDDGSGLGDTGSTGATSTGTPTIAPPPMPAWMVAAGLGGSTTAAASAGSPAAAAFAQWAAMSRMRLDPWQGWQGPSMSDPIAARAGGFGGSQTMSYGGQGGGLAELIGAVRDMHGQMASVLGDVHQAVRNVAPGTSRGFDRSMSSMVAGVAGRFG